MHGRINDGCVGRTPPILSEIDVDVIHVLDTDTRSAASQTIVQEAVVPHGGDTAAILASDDAHLGIILNQVILQRPSLIECLYTDSVVLNHVTIKQAPATIGCHIVVLKQAVADIDSLCAGDAVCVANEC